MREVEVFCKACADTSSVPAGTYIGAHQEYTGEDECGDCPRCPCGERLAAHDLLDHEDAALRSLEPRDVLWVEGEAWAPECYEQYLDELDALHDEPQAGAVLLKAGIVGAAASLLLCAIPVALWVW